MHFVVAVITSKTDANPAAIIHEVDVLMAPYDENGEMFRDESRWDWYVIGGRWDGEMFADGPLTEVVTCDLCHGTGKRPDLEELFANWNWSEEDKARWLEQTKGCNGCLGTGKQTRYVNQYNDALPRNSGKMKDINEDFEPPYACVTPDGVWHEAGRLGWFGPIPDEKGELEKEEDVWKAEWQEILSRYPDNIIVSLDCHV